MKLDFLRSNEWTKEIEMTKEVYGLKMEQMKVSPLKSPAPKYLNVSFLLPQPCFQDFLQINRLASYGRE